MKMTGFQILVIVTLSISQTTSLFAAHPTPQKKTEPPNIVLIYVDDIGFGDIGCYGATRVKTPNIDFLARNGLRFTDAHSPSATCTPSRYAMLTGEYAWRRRGTGIARGNAPLIIRPGRQTMASLLKQAGYATGVVGKWHLGLGQANMNWNGAIKPGPLELGFDYCFLIPATGDRVPCVFVENHRVVNLDPDDPIRVSYGKKIGHDPTGKENPERLKMHPSHGHNQTIVNGISRIGYMTGGKKARWVDEDIADTLTQKATAFIDKHKSERFFLYFSSHDNHVPRVPHPRFVDKTPMGPRGDAIAQLDWCVGELMKSLRRNGLRENTLVIFTSDNGPVVDDGYQDAAVEKLGDHKPSGSWRGGKYSKFEGGTRIPFIVSWPGHVEHGTSKALLGQVDLSATFAALTGATFTEKSSPDSRNLLPALLGNSRKGRDHLVEHARGIALRKGSWKFIPSSRGAKINKATNIELGNDRNNQLYNLDDDPGERNNLAEKKTGKVKELSQLLNRIRNRSQTETGRK